MSSQDQGAPAPPIASSKSPCPACGGSGQLSSFKGVSRFLLSVEECPECNGLGYLLGPGDSDQAPNPTTASSPRRSR